MIRHVLGMHIKPGDQIATDDLNIWHTIQRVDSLYSFEPYLIRLTLNNESDVLVRADQTQKIKREHHGR